MLEEISFTQIDYINLAERAKIVHLPLPDSEIESILVYLDGEWVLVINETGKAVQDER